MKELLRRQKEHSPGDHRAQEAGGSLHHFQPHRGHGTLVEEGGLGQGTERIQGFLQQLAA